MTRAEALQSLIAKVEDSEQPNRRWDWIDRAFREQSDRFALSDAYLRDDLNAVSRLEAPLRARGWFSFVEGNGGGEFYAQLQHHGRKVFGRAPSEARARLLAVLRALAAEEAAP